MVADLFYATPSSKPRSAPVENGIRTIAPEESCPRSRLGFSLGLVLELGLGGTICLGDNCPRTLENIAEEALLSLLALAVFPL